MSQMQMTIVDLIARDTT